MIRKIMLASFLAVMLLATAPAWAADQPPSISNINRSHATSADSDSSSGESADSSLNADAPPPALSESAMAAPMSPESSLSDALANFGPSSGTVVGNRALELRDEVLRLRSSVNMDANEFGILRANGASGAVQYHSTVAAITARLQNGTTRGNPILLRQWDEAEQSLNEVTNSLDRLNTLQTAVAADASLASYLLESIQAGFQLSGAVDEDHDQLKLLRDEVSRVVVQLDYLRNQVADDIERQTTYATTERSNLQALAFAITRGELMGNSLANRPVIVPSSTLMTMPAPEQQSSYAPAPAPAPTSPVMTGRPGPAPMSPREYMQESGQAPAPAAAPTATVAPMPIVQPPVVNSSEADPNAIPSSVGRLLVLIRYNQPVVDYEQQLARAVSTALQRQPEASFSVVSVAPLKGDPAELATANEAASRNAQSVKRSLIQLGLAPSRISVGNTQLQSAATPEVHVYVR